MASPIERILKTRDTILAKSRAWDRFVSAPASERDKVIAMDHFREADSLWEVCETVVNRPASSGVYGQEFTISLLVDSAGSKPTEFRSRSGRFFRPNQSGEIVFADNSQADQSVDGIGPFHSILLLVKMQAFKDRACRLLGGRDICLESLFKNSHRDERLERLLRHILDWNRESGKSNGLHNSDLLDAVVERTLDLGGHFAAKTIETGQLRPASIQRVIDYLHANFKEKITREDLARIAGVEAHHFTRLFRNTLGETPTKFLLQIRVEHAKELLGKNSDQWPLKLIAETCGFCDPTQFGKDFKRLTGMSPAKYRKIKCF